MSDIVYCPPDVDCPCYAKLVSENATLRADLQKLNERNAEYIGTIDRLRRRVAETDVEIERLRAALEKMQLSRDRYRQAWEDEKARAALAQEKPMELSSDDARSLKEWGGDASPGYVQHLLKTRKERAV
jgi:chromosome segregation ATPase